MGEIDVSGWVNRPEGPKRSRKEILERRKKRKRQRIIAQAVFGLLILLCAVLLFLLLRFAFFFARESILPVLDEKLFGGRLLGKAQVMEQISDAESTEGVAKKTSSYDLATGKPAIEEDFLTLNPYSRPGETLEEVKNIFIHYTANPGTSAEQNRSYFENLSLTEETSASAHFLIGLEGEIIQCLPLDEIGYAVKTRNYDSISIECCYTAEDGSFTEETYHSLVELTSWLLRVYGLEPEDVLRHYDVGGKKCPLYYVENEDEWESFLEDLKAAGSSDES